jgi:hemoglobin
LFIDYLCKAAGGPVFYLGRDMKLAHAGMGISGSDWAASVKHLVATLEKLSVPEKERKDLLALVAGTKADIVESP